MDDCRGAGGEYECCVSLSDSFVIHTGKAVIGSLTVYQLTPYLFTINRQVQLAGNGGIEGIGGTISFAGNVALAKIWARYGLGPSSTLVDVGSGTCRYVVFCLCFTKRYLHV